MRGLQGGRARPAASPSQRRFGAVLAGIALTSLLLAGLKTWRLRANGEARPSAGHAAQEWGDALPEGHARAGADAQMLRGRGLDIGFSRETAHAAGGQAGAEQQQRRRRRQEAFRPGEPWLDEDGVLIQTHGGGVLFHEGRYYWFGEHKGGVTYVQYSAAYSPPRVDVIGVGCYSSADLLNWRNEGLALKAGSHRDLDPGNVLERPKVMFHRPSGRFVMWMHVDTADYEWARMGVAVADSAAGPYTYLRSFRPHNQMARDFTVFQDDDGAGYIAYSSEDNAVMHVAPLTPDLTDVRPQYRRVMVGLKREAPALFKCDGVYLMLTSGCTGWAPNRAEVFYATHMLGEWQSLGNPMTGAEAPDRAHTFYSQPSFVLALQGFPGRFVMLADQWDTDNLGASRYVWLPLWVQAVPPAALAAAESAWRAGRDRVVEGQQGRVWAQPPPGPLQVTVPWLDAWRPEVLQRELEAGVREAHWRELRRHPLEED